MTAWIKSSYSYSNGNCVEVRWRKAHRSQFNGHCVEVAGCTHRIQVRDSKNPRPVLFFGAGEWQAFTESIKAG